MVKIIDNLDTSDKIVVDLDEDKILGEEKFLLPKKPKEFLFSKMGLLLKPLENSTSTKEVQSFKSLNYHLMSSDVLKLTLI